MRTEDKVDVQRLPAANTSPTKTKVLSQEELEEAQEMKRWQGLNPRVPCGTEHDRFKS